MADEKSGSRPTPIEDSPLFAEAARRVERKNAARVVLEWLEGKKGDQTVEKTTKVSLGQMAREMIEGLQGGRIFFSVKNPDKVDGPVGACQITVKIPLRESGYGGVAVQQEVRGFLVLLKVKKGVTLEELSRSGDEALARLYILDKSTTQGRVEVPHLDVINIKDPDIGPFPKLD